MSDHGRRLPGAVRVASSRPRSRPATPGGATVSLPIVSHLRKRESKAINELFT
jgi:hypothetical protein